MLYSDITVLEYNALLGTVSKGVYNSILSLFDTKIIICCLVHRGSTDYLLLLQIFSGVV